MLTCPDCGESYPKDLDVCPQDGATLLPDASFACADSDLAAGERVGEYEIVRRLGEGGFGAVYEGLQPLIGKSVAIKVLKRALSSEPEMAARFIAEARVVNQIGHPGIIDIFSFGQLPDGRHYYVMELLEGMPLDEYLRHQGALPPEDAIPILRSIAEAIDTSHAAGVAHRDLKPENVFLSASGKVKVLDFGVAKFMSADVGFKTGTGVAIGTPGYMSPEQCHGNNVDHRSDIYAFGAMSYEVFTGTRIFEGDSSVEVMMQQINAQPDTPSSRRSDLPPGLDAPILAMLEKQPADRPPTLSAAIEAVAAAATAVGHEIPESGQWTLPEVAASAPTAGWLGATTRAPNLSAAGGTQPDASGARALAGPEPRSKAPIAMAGVFVAAGLVVGAVSLWPVKPAVIPSPKPAAPAVVPAPVVVLDIRGTPPGTEVFDALGERLGTAPGPIELTRSDLRTTLSFRKAGFETVGHAVTPNASAALSISMKAAPEVVELPKPKPRRKATVRAKQPASPRAAKPVTKVEGIPEAF